MVAVRHRFDCRALPCGSDFSLKATEVFDTWKSFDQIVLRAIHASHALTEFLNEFPPEAAGPRDRVDPRSSIMAGAGI